MGGQHFRNLTSLQIDWLFIGELSAYNFGIKNLDGGIA